MVSNLSQANSNKTIPRDSLRDQSTMKATSLYADTDYIYILEQALLKRHKLVILIVQVSMLGSVKVKFRVVVTKSRSCNFSLV